MCSVLQLYVSENGIKEMTNLRALRKLRVLDLAVNRIETINVDEIRCAVGMHGYLSSVENKE